MWGFFVAINSLLNKVRICPKCRHKQAVGDSQKHDTVRCRNCGADIPPSSGRGRNS
jgi:ribosomal protein S27E